MREYENKKKNKKKKKTEKIQNRKFKCGEKIFKLFETTKQRNNETTK